MTLSAIAARYSRALLGMTGLLLVVLGGVHLAAMPFYMEWSSAQLRPEQAALVGGGMRLNHVLVGILLVPLGLSTYWASRSLEELWSFRQSVVTAITTLSLPALLMATMPVQALRAVPFLVAIVVLFLACTAQVLALLGLRASRRR